MKGKIEIKKIIEEYIQKNNISYSKLSSIEQIELWENDKISHGKYKNQIMSIYSYSFAQLYGNEERGSSFIVNADTGELLYIITPHGYVDIEE